jgi:hypothetical protein
MSWIRNTAGKDAAVVLQLLSDCFFLRVFHKEKPLRDVGRAARVPVWHGGAASRVPGPDTEDTRPAGGGWPPRKVR